MMLADTDSYQLMLVDVDTTAMPYVAKSIAVVIDINHHYD